jgi:hypothetical protein
MNKIELPINFRYGFEIEQYNISDSIRRFTEENKMDVPLYSLGGHEDCSNWEIRSAKPASYQVTIRQFDWIFFSDLSKEQYAPNIDKSWRYKIGSMDKVPTYQNTSNHFRKDKYDIPFEWWNSNPASGGAGSHIHFSINYEEFLSGELGKTEADLNRFISEYVTAWNLFQTFYWATLPFYRFRDPVRETYYHDTENKLLEWADYPPSTKHKFTRFNFSEWKDYLTHGVPEYHPYISPSPRTISLLDLRNNSKYHSTAVALNYMGIDQIPLTIELRVNENHYNFAGELTRRFLGVVNKVIKEGRVKPFPDGFYKTGGNVIEKGKKARELYDNHPEDLQHLLFMIEDIDLGREFNLDTNFKIYQYYPSFGHLAVHLARQLGTWGSDLREIPWLYSHLPCWHPVSNIGTGRICIPANESKHGIVWYFKDLLRTTDFNVVDYLRGEATEKYRCNGYDWAKPEKYIPEERVKEILTESKRFNDSVKKGLYKIW